MTRAGVFLAALVAVGAEAQALNLVAQDRHVFASHQQANFSGQTFDSETKTAPDAWPFSAGVNGYTGLPGSGVAAQQSSIERERLVASGNTVAESLPTFGNLAHIVVAESVYDVDFTLAQPRTFTLAGEIDLLAEDDSFDSCANAIGRITLSGPGGVVAEVTGQVPDPPFPPGYPPVCRFGCQETLPLSASGVLEPGTYKLVARVDTYAQSESAPLIDCSSDSRASYEVELALTRLPQPVPALPPAWLVSLVAALALAVRGQLRR
jgi:hypothetical protein